MLLRIDPHRNRVDPAPERVSRIEVAAEAPAWFARAGRRTSG